VGVFYLFVVVGVCNGDDEGVDGELLCDFLVCLC